MLYKSLFVLVDVFGKFGVFVLSVEIYQRVVHLVHPEKSGATWHPPPAPLLPIIMSLLLLLLLLLSLLPSSKSSCPPSSSTHVLVGLVLNVKWEICFPRS